jgi:hypothetical protein
MARHTYCINAQHRLRVPKGELRGKKVKRIIYRVFYLTSRHFFCPSLYVPIALIADCLFPLPSPRPQKSHVRRVTGGHLGIALWFPLRFPAEDCTCACQWSGTSQVCGVPGPWDGYENGEHEDWTDTA